MEVDIYFEPMFWLHCEMLQKTQKLAVENCIFCHGNWEPQWRTPPSIIVAFLTLTTHVETTYLKQKVVLRYVTCWMWHSKQAAVDGSVFTFYFLPSLNVLQSVLHVPVRTATKQCCTFRLSETC